MRPASSFLFIQLSNARKILPALARRAGMWYSDNLVSVYQGIVSLARL